MEEGSDGSHDQTVEKDSAVFYGPVEIVYHPPDPRGVAFEAASLGPVPSARECRNS
jgi:hypothetical protein